MNAITTHLKPMNNEQPKTESLFELLVDMLGNVDELVGITSAEEATGKHIYYMSAGQPVQMSAAQIAQRVIDAPHSRHLVWSKGMSDWSSWSKLPEVVEALKSLLKAQAPVAQAPVAQAPVAQAPVAQAPVAQAPVARQLPKDEPKSRKALESSPAQAARVSQKSSEAHTSREPSSQPPQAIAAEVVALHMDLTCPRGVQFYTGFQGELSDGGLFVETPMVLEIGQRVEVTIELGQGRAPMIAEGLVSWTRAQTEHEDRLGCGVGVFLTSPPAAMETLQAIFNPSAAIFYAA